MADFEPYADDQPSSRKQDEDTDQPEKGALLDEPEEKAAALLARIWRSQDQIMQRPEAQWRVNQLRREGVAHVELIKDDSDRWKPWVPPGASVDSTPAMNKADTLCRRLRSMILVDPPIPEPVPRTAEDEDVAAAEFSGRVLRDVQSPKKLNDHSKMGDAFDDGSEFGSGFVRYWVDPEGGDSFPIQISAGFDPMTQRFAETVEDAIDDPETGKPWPEYVERYVRPDGSLTFDVAEADEGTFPELRSEVVTGANLRFIPHNTRDIWEADGVIIASFKTLGWLRKAFPDKMSKLSDEDREELFSYRPEGIERAMSPEERKRLRAAVELDDDRLVLTFTAYYRRCPDYPKGACVIAAADKIVLFRDDWCVERDDGSVMCLPIPVTQYKQFHQRGNPYGKSTMEILGPGGELRSAMISHLLDHLDKLLHRLTFVPMHSNLQDKDFAARHRAPIIRTVPGGNPTFEDIPSFPNEGMVMFRLSSDEMENTIGMPAIAQGLESPQVQSGRHAQAILSSVHAGLSELRQNTINGYLRGCEIQLALIKAFFTVEQRIGWSGEDGAYKERFWSAADLRGTEDVELQAASMTMLSPVAKAQLAEHFAQFGIIRPDELREITTTNVGGMVGLYDDPWRMRIKRQINNWLEGPPEGWQSKTQQIMVPDPMTGQPVPQLVLDPVLQAVFLPVPSDGLPEIAMIRLRELAKLTASSRYLAQRPEWRVGVEQEFQRMMMAAAGAAGPPPGAQPNQPVSPAQRTQGPLAQPETPLPQENGPVQIQ